MAVAARVFVQVVLVIVLSIDKVLKSAHFNSKLAMKRFLIAIHLVYGLFISSVTVVDTSSVLSTSVAALLVNTLWVYDLEVAKKNLFKTYHTLVVD